MRELKWEAAATLEQQILASLVHGKLTRYAFAPSSLPPSLPCYLPRSLLSHTQYFTPTKNPHSLAASQACVGVHVETVQRLSDKANELMAEKVRREGVREGGKGGRDR
jgi:hypothetical protein